MGFSFNFLSFSSTPMEECAFQRVQPELYFQRFLEHKLRPDGRQLTELRSVRLCKGVLKQACVGSAMLAAGESRFVAGVTAAICPPHTAAPESGRIVVNVEFPKTCGLEEGCVASNVQQACLSADMSVRLSQILTHREVFDCTQLVIVPGSAVWALYVNIVCLEYDGNPLDGSLHAAVAALEDTRLPRLRWCPAEKWWRIASANDQVLEPVSSKNATAASSSDVMRYDGHHVCFMHRPVIITIAKLFGDHLLVDPTMQEEALGECFTVWRLEKQSNFQCFFQGKSSLSVSAELHKLFPVFQVAFEAIERELAKANAEAQAGTLWEPCNIDETSSNDDDDDLEDTNVSAGQ